jgi:hypothetical protein
MMRNIIRGAALVALTLVGACDKQLTVQNPNADDASRAFVTPSDIENFLGSYYRRWHTGPYGSQSNMEGMANVMSFETYSTLSNNCIGQRVGIPRAGNDNSIGNLCAPEQRRVYDIENEVVRVASSVLGQLETTSLGTPARTLRGKAFAQFLRGLALGMLAETYDSTAIVDQKTDALEPGELAGYDKVNEAALAALDTAMQDIDACVAAGDVAACTLDPNWIPSSTTFSPTEFKKLAHSYKARYRAGVARTPAERAAVDWAAVVADAQAGITADHDNITSTTNGPGDTWRSTFDGPGNYQTQPPFIIGMADTSGAYASWIALPLMQRGPNFHMQTPDKRFPQGLTRKNQQDDFPITQCSGASTLCKRYIANRASNKDLAAQIPWGGSEYDFNRFHSWKTKGDGTARNGPLVFFTLAELNLLEAEGQYRLGNYAAAAALINKTRTRGMEPPVAGDTVSSHFVARGGGLPAISADPNAPVPGGNACVPKVPQPPSFNTVACGTMFEALKWEKRLETENTHWMAWFIDSRGWGDLPEGTPLYWATPFSDLQVRHKPVYSVGGTTDLGEAGKSTYGW